MKNLKSFDEHGINEDDVTPGKEELVTISDYMQSRRYNQKLYSRLVDKLTKICEKYRTSKSEHPASKFPTLKMEISMSAKYQTPFVKITTDEADYQYLGGVESDVQEAIDEVGFTSTDTDEKNDAYYINFADE